MTPDRQTLRKWGLADHEIDALLRDLTETGSSGPPLYQQLQQRWLTPDRPFGFHRWVYDYAYGPDALRADPQPAWFPDSETAQRANVTRWCQRLGLDSVRDLHRWSVTERESFWSDVVRALEISFLRPPDRVWDLSAGAETPTFLPGAVMNIARSCLQGEVTRPAVRYEDESGGTLEWTLEELRERVQRVAGALRASGLSGEFRAAVMMPMTADAVAIYLGIIWAGGAVVAIADSFAPPEVATRLDITHADLLFVQGEYVRGGKTVGLYQRVLDADPPPCIVVGEGTPRRQQDQRFDDWCQSAAPMEKPEPRQPMDVTNFLFSSGTTGVPKAIPWTHATPIKCASDALFHHDVHAGDVLAWPTNLGWMMGPWLIYASLLNGASMALYGGSPLGRSFVDFTSRSGVTMLGVVPSLVRGWRDRGILDDAPWSSIRLFSSTGECSQPEDMLYLMSRAGYRPIIEYCGGTELAGGYITSTIVEANAPSVFTGPAMGLDFVILDEDHRPASVGEVFLVPPSFGLSTTLLNRDHHESYFAEAPPGPAGELLRKHGDLVEKLGTRRFRVLGRADDTMNLGGIKVSSAEIERVVSTVDAVADAAAVAAAPPNGGPSQLVVFAVLKDAVAEPQLDIDALEEKIRAAIKQQLNPLFKLARLCVVSELPRTASNKVMRRVLRDQAATVLKEPRGA